MIGEVQREREEERGGWMRRREKVHTELSRLCFACL